VTDAPVEVTALIQGQPEAGPTVLSDTERGSHSIERGGVRCAREVLLLAHVPDQSVRSDYDDLQLHHGARIRVMTAAGSRRGYPIRE